MREIEMVEVEPGRFEASGHHFADEEDEDVEVFIAKLNALSSDDLFTYLSGYPNGERKALIDLLSKDAAKRYLKGYFRCWGRVISAYWRYR